MKVLSRAHQGILVFGFAAAWMLLVGLCAKGLKRVRTFGWITCPSRNRCQTPVTVLWVTRRSRSWLLYGC
jgi:hypothetical protein